MSKRKKSEISAQTDQKIVADKYARQLRIIQELSQLIGQEEKTEKILQTALGHLLKTLGYLAAQIYRLSPSGQDLWLYLELGSGSKPVTQNVDIFSLQEENIVSHAMRSGEPVYVPNIHKGPYSYYGQSETDLGVNSELSVPLKCGQTLLGVLRIQSDRLDGFDDDDIGFVASLSNLLANTIKTTRTAQKLQDDLQEISILYNLQREGERENYLQSTRETGQVGYQYDKTNSSITEIKELPPSADLAKSKEQKDITTTHGEHKKELIAPIKLYEETIGIIGIENASTSEDWSTDDIRLLEEVSSQVGLAIENSRLLQQTQKRTQELSLLFETSRQLSETIELHQIYQILANQIINYLRADHCSVSLLNKARTHFETIVESGKEETSLDRAVTKKYNAAQAEAVDDSPALQQMLESPTLIVEHSEDLISPFQMLAIFPLKVRNNLIGILKVVHSVESRKYTQNELQLAQAIISQVTVAIENAQLFEQTQNALAETQKLYELSRSLVESVDLEETFEVVLASVKVYNVDRVSISLLERDPKGEIENVTIVASWDRESNKILPVGTKISSDMFSLVQAYAEPPFSPLISEDLSRPDKQDQRMDEAFRLFMHEGLGAITLFSTPMFLGPEYKGVLSISTRTPHTYTPQELRIYQTLADQAIVAIERHRLLEATRRERDHAALLYEFSQKLNQTASIDEVKEVVLTFIERVGAAYGEMYVTDYKDFYSMVSNIPNRQTMSPDQTETFIKVVLSKGIEAQALKQNKTVLKNRSQQDIWYVEDEIVEDQDWMHSIISTPFHSRRSNLQGVLTFFATMEGAFTEEHISMFESMAIQLSATLENIWLLQQTATALSETELLYRATREFNSAQHLEDLLVVLVESFASPRVHPKTDIKHMSIGLITALEEDGAPKNLNILASWDKDDPELPSTNHPLVTNPNLRISSDDYPFIRQISPNTPYKIEQQDSEGIKTFLNNCLGQTRSALSIPLTIGKNWLGSLFIASQADKFVLDTNTVHQISNLAGQITVVIQNLQLIEETQQNLYNSEILSHLSQELLVADTSEAIYNLSLDAIAATEPSRGAAIFMYDQMEGSIDLEMVALWDNPNQTWPPISPGVRFSTAELGLVPLLKTGQTIVSNNVNEDQHFTETLQQLLILMQIRSLGAVPIWLNKEVNGFILIGNREPSTFSPDTIRLYENIGRLTSGALENQRLFEQAQYRATQLQTAAEVSQAATSYLDLDTLLLQSVNLIRDRFDFYHVSIFLVDEYQKYAIVEASTGEIGQKMLAMKHKLAVGGKSIVGTATGTGKPRIALDVGKDAVHFNNPLLPDTRSEMALPLIARGTVIGALDVQSTKQGAFTNSDITILQSMANQLANAIEAARSYQESQKALDDVSRMQQRFLREQWSTFLKEQQVVTGYRLTKEGLITIDEADWELQKHRDSFNRAIEAKRPIIVSDLNSKPVETINNGREKAIIATEDSTPDDLSVNLAETKDTATLIAPLSLYGQVAMGAVDFELFDESLTNEDTLKIIEAITAQAAQAIEAARLFEQTQTAREEAEALYEVGRALVAAESQQEMFHTVLREMLSTLGLKQGGILFFEKDKRFGKLHALFMEGKAVPPNLRIPIEGNPSYQRLIETKQPVSIVDFANDPLVAPVREINPDHKIASLLLVPLIVGDEVIGALGADAVEQNHEFTEREINLARAMADQLSLLLQNRRLIDETRRRAIQLQTSSDVGRVATSILDQDSMLEKAVELIKDRFGFYHVQIFLTDESHRYAILHKSSGKAGEKLLMANYEVGIGERNVVGQAAYRRRSLVVRDIDPKDGDFSVQHNEFLPDARAEVAIPLQVGNTLIGILDVHSISPDDFTDEDIATLETLAAQIAIAIQNARVFREQQETAERLKEIDKLKTQFLANMSHELRTPLNSIIGFSRVILKGIDGPLTELQKTDLTSIYNSGQHLLGLINNVLDLSKIEAGKMELNFEEVEIGPIVKGVLSTALALVKDKPVELTQEVPENLPLVWADPTRIRQVILNLVSNACKFTDQGSVSVRVIPKKEKVIFSVSDTGVGIETNKLDSIFEEFTQVDASTTRKVGGTGLGLPISRHFVEMHQGQIWVDSTPGKGSTFSFAIPIKLSAEEPETTTEIPPINGKEEGSKKIIAIDDDPGVINLYKRFLEKRNYDVIEVDNTQNVIELVRTYTPFAILLDILMPDKDGWRILKELKQNPFTKDIPVIICSIISDRNRGLSLGAVDYLTKPIVESELVNALKNVDHQQKDQVKVLVVDDQADDILLIRRILEAHNFKIIEANNGRAGLDLAKSRAPNLVILDLKMPDMDGFAVIDALKSDKQTSEIPIIIVSAKDLTSQEYEFLTDQVEVLLRKGIFTENQLLNDVNQVLEKYRTPTEDW